MNSYVIKKYPFVTDEIWENAEILDVNYSPWKQYPCRYNTMAKIVYTEEAIYVNLKTTETKLKAVHNEKNSDVCDDSCMEFFLSPDENDTRYFNFEINPLGVMLLFVCNGRGNYTSVDVSHKIFQIKSIITDDYWQLLYKIPFSFIKEYFPNMTGNMRGNIYKCGRKTVHRHYGCWNPIETKKPEFHCPQYFGQLILEDFN